MQAADCVIYCHQHSSVQPRQALEIEREPMCFFLQIKYGYQN